MLYYRKIAQNSSRIRHRRGLITTMIETAHKYNALIISLIKVGPTLSGDIFVYNTPTKSRYWQTEVNIRTFHHSAVSFFHRKVSYTSGNITGKTRSGM